MPAPHTLVPLTPATGAIAANRPGSAHASLVEKMAPSEIPVAYTRLASMHSVRDVVASICFTKSTSATPPGSGGHDQCRMAPVPAGVITM